MDPIHISDGDDPRLTDYAGVRDPAFLRDHGLLIAEGRFVVRRLITSGRLKVRSLLLNDAASIAFADVAAAAAHDVAIYVAPADVITAATGFNLHRGCLAVAERPAPVPMDALVRSADLLVVLERVVDPDNIGSVFRSAEAFGADAVLLSPGCGDPFYRKAIRTSSGAALVVPTAEATPWPDALDRLRSAGIAVAALTPDAGAADIGRFVETPMARGRLAVLMGTEGQGLTAEALARSDIRVRIPMQGALDSLNIATAAGIALHRVRDARQGTRLRTE